jgi:hypothetical protein
VTAPKERKEIFQALAKTAVRRIPHVHLRHDMTESEINFLVSRYQTKVFTVHYQHFLKFFTKSEFRRQMFIENNMGPSRIINPATLKKVGGSCIDLSHLAHFSRRLKKHYKMSQKVAGNYPIGCNHLSAVLPNGLSWHRVLKISDLDYLKEIDQKYFSKYICLELANSIKEQLEFGKYIAKMLAKSWNNH